MEGDADRGTLPGRPKLCPACKGTTYRPGVTDATYSGPSDDCDTCGGVGTVR